MQISLTEKVCAAARPSVSQVVDVGADLQSWAQFDVHGGHEVLLLQQQQSLSIDLLREELGRQVLAALQ